MKTIYKKLLFLLLLLPFSVLAQNNLSGVVLDSKTNQPLPGVNVIVQGTQQSAVTDFDGKFQLSKVKQGDEIVFSFIGYTDSTVSYSNQNNLNVKLEEETNQLQEVVVQIGYGTVKKKDATGAVTTLSAEDFNKGSVVTAENLLSGKIAGVTINTGGGAPGSGSEIRIRGGSSLGSLGASNDPLIVIDGLPISNTSVTGSTSILSSINPNDIATFTVLKDASATAIYGSRASNGVIIITTKKGSKKLAVDYNFQYGSGKVYNKIDVFSANEYRNLINEVGTPGQIANLGTANTDWQDAIYRRTDFVDNNISLKGNLLGVMPARLSFGNTYQEGLRLTNKFNRNTFSLNLSPSLFNNHLQLNLAANYSNQKNRFADGVEGAAIRFDPTRPIYDANSPYDGFFEYYNPNLPGNPYLNPSIGNPVAQLLQTRDIGESNRLYGNFEIDYKLHFFPDLRAVVNFGYDRNSGQRSTNRPTTARSGFGNNNISLGTRFYEELVVTNSLLDGYLVYKKKFGKLDFDATGGYSYQKFERSGLRPFNATNPAAVQLPLEEDDIVLIGYFARANFSYNDKYLLTFAYRRDGTSRFNDNNRFGNFPAAAFAWKISEDFFKNSKIISDLKLRLGYGITGQQDISAGTFYLPQYNIGNPNSQYTFGNTNYPIAQPAGYNENIKWEETTTYNAGLDFGIANNRVTGSLDVYYKKSTDLFQDKAPFPDGSNFTNAGAQNVGSLSNKGIELGVDFALFKSNKFQWDVNINASKYERRIDKIASGLSLFIGSSGAGTGGTSQILQENFTPGSFFVYKQLYNTSGNPIEGAFADLNGDGIITGDDRYIYYNADPDLLLGFTSNIKYNNFDLTFNLRASVGNRVLNIYKSTGSYYSQLVNGPNQNTTPNVLNTNFQTQTGEQVISDIFVENASFLRMDFATLGYTFPNWLDSKASLRLFGGVQNPFIITKYTGLDPEVTGGNDNTIYPRQRQILFGANVKF